MSEADNDIIVVFLLKEELGITKVMGDACSSEGRQKKKRRIKSTNSSKSRRKLVVIAMPCDRDVPDFFFLIWGKDKSSPGLLW